MKIIKKIESVSSRKFNKTPRGKSHSTKKEKITIGVYLNRKLVERAKNR